DSAHEAKSLGITAIAEIFDQKSGRSLWQTRQLCSDISGSTRDSVYSCAVELAQRIGERLPRAGR
ncbi:MAG TPA: hypothetical protein VKA67_05350, partial [Verrucomicrobiae bacterium]|nr:hypothetical protein [Verrucomicrobiae bacterium]